MLMLFIGSETAACSEEIGAGNQAREGPVLIERPSMI